VLVRY
jgi:hypothetical protein